MQAHRSHLYQYLSNELKLQHWKVTVLYAVVQLCFEAIAVVSYSLVKAMKPGWMVRDDRVPLFTEGLPKLSEQ